MPFLFTILIIILVIACSATVTLSIRNTANTLVKNYEEAHDVIASISFDRGQLSKDFKGGEDARKSNIEANIDLMDILNNNLSYEKQIIKNRIDTINEMISSLHQDGVSLSLLKKSIKFN